MAQDLMYYFDKKSPYQRHELGEIQTDFNMSRTIDGTKDSMQVQVYNFNENEITPNTILHHNATNTWWVVQRDIVKRNAHEKGYFYTHNLTIRGAIDLLGVRDLTDIGFNDKTYTIDQFIKRLFKLSTFEFPITINYGNNVDQNKVVDYIKSFENYTPLSALREFLNGYNCDAKLIFTTTTTSGQTYISGATLNIIPRTGNVDLDQIDISVFDDIRESKTINKESYGTTVISNAQNVISTIEKTYPQIGGVRLISNDYSLTNVSEGYVELPFPAYKVNWVRAISPIKIVISYGTTSDYGTETKPFFPQNKSAFDNEIQTIMDNDTSYQQRLELYEWIIENKEKIREFAIGGSQITFYDGFDYNPVSHKINKWESVPYLPFMYYGNVLPPDPDKFTSMVLADKETYDRLYEKTHHAIYWERGSNKIDGFELFSYANNTYYPTRTDLKMLGYTQKYITKRFYDTSTHSYYNARIWIVADNYDATYSNLPNSFINHISLRHTVWQVNYIPMSDVKIKYDNARNDIDTHIYNQNGKLNDSVALSKLIDSYSKEIQSDNITRYMHYTKFSDIPQVGQLVNKNNEIYVINNISYDFYQNEEKTLDQVSYYIECEFTMSKYMSVKSLMVNPNSNIRDYGIPQKYNVKRRQVYRDYYEFTLNSSTQDSGANQDTPYVPLDRYIVIGTNAKKNDYDHTAIMKIDYDEPVDGHTSWFYQLNTIAYSMSKSVYELLDFNDNNVIGIDVQNTTSGFNMSRLFDSNALSVCTPISYVDDNGKFSGITLQLVNKNNLYELYQNIYENNNIDPDYDIGSHVFVGDEFYYGKYNYTQVNNELNAFSTDFVIPYVSISGGITTIKIPLSELDFDNNNVDLDSVVINDIDGITYIPRIGGATSGIVGSFSIITENNIKYLQITDTSSNFNPSIRVLIVDYDVSYRYATKVYDGAIDIKDYELQELNYDKDAIEVPVFEYILQLGDSEQVEVGERILDANSGLLQMYTCEIRNHNTTTQLNASKVFTGLEISGDTLSGDDNYDRQVSIADTSAVDISFEENNTIMRIKVYLTQEALFYGNSDQEFAYQSTQVSPTQVPKSSLIGKDIVIYKNVINSMAYDIDEDVATCDYDNELMFIIHNPQNADFDGDDLLVNVNYYRLK